MRNSSTLDAAHGSPSVLLLARGLNPSRFLPGEIPGAVVTCTALRVTIRRVLSTKERWPCVYPRRWRTACPSGPNSFQFSGAEMSSTPTLFVDATTNTIVAGMDLLRSERAQGDDAHARRGVAIQWAVGPVWAGLASERRSRQTGRRGPTWCCLTKCQTMVRVASRWSDRREIDAKTTVETPYANRHL